MKFVFVVLLLLDSSLSKGQQNTGGSTHISLRLAFPPVYNSYSKSCCKLYPGRCYLLLDSGGYTCDFLKDRVTRTQGDSWIEFTISNPQFNDQGFYRCIVTGTSFYKDYYIEITETPIYFTKLPPKTATKSQTTPMTVLKPHTHIPESTAPATELTAPVLGPDHGNLNSGPWSFATGATVSIVAVICVCSVVGFIFCWLKAKQKQSNKNLADSLQTDTGLDISAIVYTTVDFKAHPKPTELYENLRVHKNQEGLRAPVHDGNVEYSTLAIHRCS